MKTRKIAILLLTILTTSHLSFAGVPRRGDSVPATPQLTTTSEAEWESLADVLSVPSPTPRGPQDLLQDYEAGMASVAQEFSGKLAAIAEAVQRGELSREQGEQISGEQYQLAQMQFALLSTLREMLAEDLARTAASPDADAKETQENESCPGGRPILTSAAQHRGYSVFAPDSNARHFYTGANVGAAPYSRTVNGSAATDK